MAKDIAKGSPKLPKSLQPITLRNYDQMVLLYGKLKQLGDNWPFLSHDEDQYPATASEHAWDLYFRDHLGGFPPTYRLFRNDVIKYLNVPEERPELFDKSYTP